MKTPKEKGLLVVFQRDLTWKDRIKLARERPDTQLTEISPWSICFLPSRPEMPRRQRSGPSLGLNRSASPGPVSYPLCASTSLFINWGWQGKCCVKEKDQYVINQEDINVLEIYSYCP